MLPEKVAQVKFFTESYLDRKTAAKIKKMVIHGGYITKFFWHCESKFCFNSMFFGTVKQKCDPLPTK